MILHITQPSGILAQYIRYFWSMESAPYEENVCERVVPLGNIQLMFHYKKPFIMKHANNIITTQPHSIISGINKTFFDVSTNGDTGVIAVSFFPAGACHFFPFPLIELKNQNINLRDIFNKEIRQVEEMIGHANCVSERIRIIEGFLMKRLSPAPHYDYLLIKKGIEIIKHNKGAMSASELSENLAVTTKKLERKFSALLGNTPKQFLKLARFFEVIRHLNKTKNEDLTAFAYKNGYFDQSHFIKDFKTYSGYTPREFLLKCPCDSSTSDFSL